MKLYVFPMPTNNATKVLFTAELLGLDYEPVFINPQKGAHKSPDFVAINPMSRIPVLQDGGKLISEGNAIARYLCACANDKLYGSTPFEKAVVDQWIDRFTHDIGLALATYTYEEIIVPVMLGKVTDIERVAQAGEKLKGYLPIVEQQLDKSAWLAGDAISLADSIAYAFVAATEKTSLSLKDYPNIINWAAQLNVMPEWQKVMSRFPVVV